MFNQMLPPTKKQEQKIVTVHFVVEEDSQDGFTPKYRESYSTDSHKQLSFHW